MLLKFNKALKTLDKWHDALDKKRYEPLIKVWSGPKGTRRHLYKGAKSKRNHHFLSDGERRLGIIKDSLPETVNYFEQYPLWDLELCVRIAIDMGIKYPCDEEGEAYVLSTDFYCLETDLADNNLATKEVARTYKTLDSLDREIKHPVSVTRTLQKLELERRYYEDKQIPFVLETDHNVSVNCAYNLQVTQSKGSESLILNSDSIYLQSMGSESLIFFRRDRRGREWSVGSVFRGHNTRSDLEFRILQWVING